VRSKELGLLGSNTGICIHTAPEECGWFYCVKKVSGLLPPLPNLFNGVLPIASGLLQAWCMKNQKQERAVVKVNPQH